MHILHKKTPTHIHTNTHTRTNPLSKTIFPFIGVFFFCAPDFSSCFCVYLLLFCVFFFSCLMFSVQHTRFVFILSWSTSIAVDCFIFARQLWFLSYIEQYPLNTIPWIHEIKTVFYAYMIGCISSIA